MIIVKVKDLLSIINKKSLYIELQNIDYASYGIFSAIDVPICFYDHYIKTVRFQIIKKQKLIVLVIERKN